MHWEPRTQNRSKDTGPSVCSMELDSLEDKFVRTIFVQLKFWEGEQKSLGSKHSHVSGKWHNKKNKKYKKCVLCTIDNFCSSFLSNKFNLKWVAVWIICVMKIGRFYEDMKLNYMTLHCLLALWTFKGNNKRTQQIWNYAIRAYTTFKHRYRFLYVSGHWNIS